MASKIFPAELDKMMGFRPGAKQTITEGKKKNNMKPMPVKRKRGGTKGLLKPK